jgi:hypothetical protein
MLTAAASARFEVKLNAGATNLQTWSYDDAGSQHCGAYYVYVRRRG